MFNKVGTKWLWVAVLVLGAMYLFSKYGDRSKERNFKENVLSLDTAAVSSITLAPAAAAHESFQLIKEGEIWKVNTGGHSYSATQSKVQALLSTFAELPVKRYAGRGEKIMEQYGISDSLRNDVSFKLNNGDEVHLRVGRTSKIEDPTRRTEGEVLMYVKMDNEEEVFAVPANPNAGVDQTAEQWRQAYLVKSDPANWQRITFSMGKDSGYTLERVGDVWMIDRDTANVNSVNSFTGALSKAMVPRFAPPGIELLNEQRAYQLTIRGAEEGPIDLSVYAVNGRLYAQSSQNSENIMEFDPLRDIPRLFRSRSIFLN